MRILHFGTLGWVCRGHKASCTNTPRRYQKMTILFSSFVMQSLINRVQKSDSPFLHIRLEYTGVFVYTTIVLHRCITFASDSLTECPLGVEYRFQHKRIIMDIQSDLRQYLQISNWKFINLIKKYLITFSHNLKFLNFVIHYQI